MTDPFDGFNADPKNEELERQLDAVKALDEMDKDVTSWEADFIESAIIRLRSKILLTPPMLEVLRSMCEKYEVDFR